MIQLDLTVMHGFRHECGAALIMCLMLLSALSLLGLSAASEHVMQLRMSHNQESGLQRRISANTALNWAEDWLQGLPGAERPSACLAECSAMDVIRPPGAYGAAPQHRDLEWWRRNGHAAGYRPQTGAPPQPDDFDGPWYIVEEMHTELSADSDSPVRETAYYRILARSSAPGATHSGMTESILARPWGDETLSNGFPADAEIPSFCTSVLGASPCGRLAWRWVKQ